ncbi:MAG: ferrochelatase [Spongiibacteraceae bacterium]
MKAAIVLMNLGTPTEASEKAVKDFLREFLSDRRVVEVPRLLWMIILHAIILTFRTPRVTKAYQKIWGDGGSPLRLTTKSQAEKLQQYLQLQQSQSSNQQNAATSLAEVHYAMTYSGPSLEDKVQQFEREGIDHIVVLPLYPQFSATTTGSIYDQVASIGSKRRNIPQIHIIKQYFDHPLYIKALADTVVSQWQNTGKPEKLVMSFHSIPQAYVDDGDPYYQQCLATAALLAEALGLDQDDWLITFQSRLGYAKWLSPYTSDALKQLAQNNIKHVDVICPAFAADCLETLEEIKIENCEIFMEQGGEVFNLIPCLNDSPLHIEMMASIVNQYLPKIN